MLGDQTIALAFTGTVNQHAAQFLKKLRSTLLFPFLKPAVNAGKHAHKRDGMN